MQTGLERGPQPFGSSFLQRRTFRDGRLFLSAFVRVEVQGREHLPDGRPFLLVSNHLSHFDPPLLTMAAGRWIDWLAMVELYRFRPFAAYLRALAAIPLDRARRDRAAVANVLRHLRAGRPVGIFPEGGIRAGSDSVLRGGPLDPGACRLSLAAKVPLVPTVILGSERLYTVGGWLVPRRAFRVEVRFGAPLAAPVYTGKLGWEGVQDFNARLAAALRALADGDG